MDEFAIAVKAFIVNERDEILLVKRSSDDVHAACAWEIPGGRLDSMYEDPFVGLKREVKEEVSLDISIEYPLMVDHFVREDGQRITMLIFLCKANTNNIVLSDEHEEYVWASLDLAKEKVVYFFLPCITSFETFFLGKI